MKGETKIILGGSAVQVDDHQTGPGSAQTDSGQILVDGEDVPTMAKLK